MRPSPALVALLLVVLSGCAYIGQSPEPTSSPTAVTVGTTQPTLTATATPSDSTTAAPTDVPTLEATTLPQTPTQSQAPTDGPTTTPLATPTGPAAGWQRIPDFPPDGAEVSSLIATDFGFVATGNVENSHGCPYGGSDGRIWSSADGLSWAATEFPKTYIDRLVSAGGMPYAFGYSGDYCAESSESFLLRSSDGSTWERIENSLGGDEDVTAIGSVGDTLLALGEGLTVDGHTYGVVWTSQDGVDWQRSTGGPTPGLGGFELVTAGDVVVALDSTSHIPFWHSADRGRTWRESDYRPRSWLRPDDGVGAHGFLVAVGDFCCTTPDGSAGVSLVSTNGGATWQESQPFAASPYAVEAVPEGFIALGEETWFSTDGLDWTLAEPLPRIGDPYWFLSAADAHRLVVVNGRFAWLAATSDLGLGASGSQPALAELPEIGDSYSVNMGGYCSLGEIDFALRTWVPDPPFTEDYFPYSFGDNARGTLTLVGPDELRFEGRNGTIVTLRPSPVAIVNVGCA